MKKVVITGPRRAELVDVPDPRPIRDWALVKVHIAPMCTEYKAFVAGRNAQFLGHEAVGEVVALAQPCKVEVGQRVVVQPQYPCGKCTLCISGNYIHCEHNINYDSFVGSPEGKATMAQFLLKPSWLLSPIPDDMSYERAALALCALGPSFGAFEKMSLSAFDTVLITGLGPVGLGAVVNAKFRGARVIGVDPIQWRRQRALELGADYVFHPEQRDLRASIFDLTEGRGVDCALDCSGALSALRLCVDATRRLGKVAVVGECSLEFSVKPSPDLIRKGLTLVGSWHYNLADYPKIISVIRHARGIDKLVSHVFPFSNVQDAFETSASQQCAKILLKPWE